VNPLLAMYVTARPLWVLAKYKASVELVAMGQGWTKDSYRWVPWRAITEARKPPVTKRGKPWLIIVDFPPKSLQAEIKRIGWRLISPEGFVYV
jgi:hypothetical protein